VIVPRVVAGSSVASNEWSDDALRAATNSLARVRAQQVAAIRNDG
jgi:hypothetical protein